MSRYSPWFDECICHRPRVEVEFSWNETNQEEVYQRLQFALQHSSRFYITSRQPPNKLSAWFLTTFCCWLDRLTFELSEAAPTVAAISSSDPNPSPAASSPTTTLVYGESHSTNVCPIWCVPCRYLLCCFCNAFSDWGQNNEHLRVIMKRATEPMTADELVRITDETLKENLKLRRAYQERLIHVTMNSHYERPPTRTNLPSTGTNNAASKPTTTNPTIATAPAPQTMA